MGRKIFIIDDDAMYAMFMEDHLKSKGHEEISTFSTGEAGLEKLNEGPEVILLDYNLDADVPGAMNGKEVLEEIRKSNTKVHIIMISAQEAYGEQDSGEDKALHYIVKGNQSFTQIDSIIESLG